MDLINSLRTDLPIGKWIQKHRRAQKMSRKELAEKSGLSISYIAALEQGRHNPSVAALYAVVTALHLKIEDLGRE